MVEKNLNIKTKAIYTIKYILMKSLFLNDK